MDVSKNNTLQWQYSTSRLEFGRGACIISFTILKIYSLVALSSSPLAPPFSNIQDLQARIISYIFPHVYCEVYYEVPRLLSFPYQWSLRHGLRSTKFPYWHESRRRYSG